MDVKPEFQEKLWQTVRSIGPAVGARERVLLGLAERIERSPRGRFGFVPRIVLVFSILLISTAVAMAAFYWWRATRAPAPQTIRIRSSARVSILHPDRPMPPQVLQPVPPTIAPPPSEAQRPVAPPRIRENKHAHIRETSRSPAIDSAPQAVPTSPSLLAEQVAMYRRIAALKDDEAALAAWRAMRERWPTSTLRHEIDLNVVDTLGRLGRHEEARREAAAFLQRFPNSPRAAEMWQLLHERAVTK